eukprot:868430-Pleurochrysis_carterae.AAC.6
MDLQCTTGARFSLQTHEGRVTLRGVAANARNGTWSHRVVHFLEKRAKLRRLRPGGQLRARATSVHPRKRSSCLMPVDAFATVLKDNKKHALKRLR